MKLSRKLFGAVAVVALIAVVASLNLAPAKAAANVGTQASDFSLVDVNGKQVSLSDYKGKWVVLEWFNHGCPYVQKHYGSGNMQSLQKDYTAKGVVWLSIVSSAPGKQGYYSAAEHKKMAAEKGTASTDILIDETGKVGKLYGAKTTPHMFVINPQGQVVYNGAIDDHPNTNREDIAVSKNYVRGALDSALAGKPVPVATSQPYGCTVKYAD
jgi:peroxiredoxin